MARTCILLQILYSLTSHHLIFRMSSVEHGETTRYNCMLQRSKCVGCVDNVKLPYNALVLTSANGSLMQLELSKVMVRLQYVCKDILCASILYWEIKVEKRWSKFGVDGYCHFA